MKIQQTKITKKKVLNLRDYYQYEQMISLMNTMTDLVFDLIIYILSQ